MTRDLASHRAAAAVVLLLAALLAPCRAQDFATAYRNAESLRMRGGISPQVIQQCYREALVAFDRLDPADPARGAALAAAAFCAEQAVEHARAAALAEEGLAAATDVGFLVELRVRALTRAGEASTVLQAIALWSPREPDAVVRALRQVYGEAAGALCEAAEVALRQGETEVGLRLFAALAEAAERHPTALANWALALHHVGREEEAEARYREALAKAPEDSEIWNDLGLLLKGQGRDAEAMAAFRRSLELDPSPTKLGPAGTNLALMQRLGRAGQPPVDVVHVLRGGLGRSPVSVMVRRLILDELRDRRSFPAPHPDTGSVSR